MINRIIHFSVYHRNTVLFGLLAIIGIGVASFRTLPIDAVPDITNNQVQINTTIEGLAPEEIERSITFPVESSMRGIAGVTQVRSITRFGLSQVTVVFRDQVEIYRARQMVTERLQQALNQLPKGAKASLGPITTGLGEIFYYSVDFEKPANDPTARFNQLIELRSIQDWYIKPRLLTVEGVADVNSIGGFEKQYHIQPTPEKMSRFGIHFGDLIEAIERVNKNVGGGYVQQTAEQFLVQGIGLFQSIEDIKRVPIKSLESFKTVAIGDVAEVGLGRELRTGAATLNGRESVLGIAMMLMGENSRTVSIRVAEKIGEISKALPPGVIITPVYNRSELVNATLGTVEHNLITGAVLVVLVLLFLVGNVRAALITAFTIPLTLLFTFAVMKPLGLSGNLMSLGALDFGIIVDGVVIVIDNCVRVIHERAKHLQRSLSKDELKKAIYDASVEIRVAAGFGELIIVVVFLPIFGLVGIEGKMFHPMAATFAIAVLGALIFSFTAAPALASLLLRGNSSEKEPRIMYAVRKVYEPSLAFALKRRRATLMTALFSVVLGIGLFMSRGGEFLPQLSEGSIAFHVIRPVNISTDQSIAFQLKVEELMKIHPEVRLVFSRLGTAEVATDPMGVNVSDTYVMLKSKQEFEKQHPNTRMRSQNEVAESIIQNVSKAIPGVRLLASQPIQMRFNELLEGTRADVTVKVFGPEMPTLVEVAKEIQEQIESIPGAGDVEVDLAGTSPVLKAEPKHDVLRRYGLSAAEVLEAVSIGIGGEEVGSFYEKDKRFPLIVRIPEQNRSDLDSLRELPVGISANSTVPISQLADLRFDQTYSSISREDSLRRSAVLINLRGRDTESFVTEAEAKVKAAVKLPEGYYIQWGGNFKNLQEARTRLLILTPVALILVLLMIYAAFKSVSQTALVFSCVPLALVGGVLGLVVFGLPFSISAGIGFIALSGIAVLNGVVLLNYFNDLSAEGLRGEELVKKGTSIRLRPVLMTALVDIFGFLPMTLSTGVGAEVQRPLASVVIGGIISSTLLTLILLPTLYCWFEKLFVNRASNEAQT